MGSTELIILYALPLDSAVSLSVFSPDFLFVKQELSKFINHCNEVKAATSATKEGGQLSIVKTLTESTSSAKK